MANQFKSALANRERDRQLLAEALSSKFESERKKSQLVRAMLFCMIATAGYYCVKSGAGVKRPSPMRPALGASEALSQMKSQISRNEPMMVGEAPAKASSAAGSQPKLAGGNKESYASDRIPAHVYDEVNRAGGHSQTKNGYTDPGPAQKIELEGMAGKRARHVAQDCGKYRPLAQADLPKLAPAARRALHQSQDQLYARASGTMDIRHSGLQAPKAP